MKEESICVSIFMLAYNQKEFISQAIEGVLMQKTNFPYQLVIGEDFSTDGTREICNNYAQKNPGRIKLILNGENLGIGANYVKTYGECSGKYVAICDGDDYWVDPLKLQKQVDFLEENQEFRIVYTNNKSLLPSGKMLGPKKDPINTESNFEDLVKGNYIPSVTSLFYYTPLSPAMKLWLPNSPFGDWPTYLLVLSEGGKAFYLSDTTAVYRKDIGTSTILRQEKTKMGIINSRILRNLLNDEKFMNRTGDIQRGLFKFELGVMASYNKESKFIKSLRLAMKLMVHKNSTQVLRTYFYSLKRSVMAGEYERKSFQNPSL